MSTVFKHTVSPLVVVLGVLAANSAHAQGAGAPWLADRSRTEGPGFRVGDLELHPGIGIELGYDTNVFYQDQNTQDSLILRVTPHINISTLGAQRRGEGEAAGTPPVVAFQAGLSASYYEFLATDAQRNLSADADVRLTINPQRPFSFTIYDTLGRTIRPFTEPAAGPVNYARIRNELGTKVTLGTDGGIFGVDLGYAFGVDIFEGAAFQYGNRMNHRATLGSRWKFLPNTAFISSFAFNYSTFINTDEVSAVLRPDGYGISSQVGLNGALTNALSFTTTIGYVAGFYDAGAVSLEEYESVVGQAELRWKLAPTAQWGLGYQSDFFNAFAGSYARRDRGYTNFQVLIAGALLLGVEGSVGHLDFGPQLAADGTPLGEGGVVDRTDVLVQASLFGEYRFTDWLALNANVAYTGNFTDFAYLRDVSMAIIPDPAEFQKFEAWLGVRAFY